MSNTRKNRARLVAAAAGIGLALYAGQGVAAAEDEQTGSAGRSGSAASEIRDGDGSGGSGGGGSGADGGDGAGGPNPGAAAGSAEQGGGNAPPGDAGSAAVATDGGTGQSGGPGQNGGAGQNSGAAENGDIGESPDDDESESAAGDGVGENRTGGPGSGTGAGMGPGDEDPDAEASGAAVAFPSGSSGRAGPLTFGIAAPTGLSHVLAPAEGSDAAADLPSPTSADSGIAPAALMSAPAPADRVADVFSRLGLGLLGLTGLSSGDGDVTGGPASWSLLWFARRSALSMSPDDPLRLFGRFSSLFATSLVGNSAPTYVGAGDGQWVDGRYYGTVVFHDRDGDRLTYSVTGQPANGDVIMDGKTGRFVFIPNDDYRAGEDVTFGVKARDDNGFHLHGLNSIIALFTGRSPHSGRGTVSVRGETGPVDPVGYDYGIVVTEDEYGNPVFSVKGPDGTLIPVVVPGTVQGGVTKIEGTDRFVAIYSSGAPTGSVIPVSSVVEASAAIAASGVTPAGGDTPAEAGGAGPRAFAVTDAGTEYYVTILDQETGSVRTYHLGEWGDAATPTVYGSTRGDYLLVRDRTVLSRLNPRILILDTRDGAIREFAAEDTGSDYEAYARSAQTVLGMDGFLYQNETSTDSDEETGDEFHRSRIVKIDPATGESLGVVVEYSTLVPAVDGPRQITTAQVMSVDEDGNVRVLVTQRTIDGGRPTGARARIEEWVPGTGAHTVEWTGLDGDDRTVIPFLRFVVGGNLNDGSMMIQMLTADGLFSDPVTFPAGVSQPAAAASKDAIGLVTGRHDGSYVLTVIGLADGSATHHLLVGEVDRATGVVFGPEGTITVNYADGTSSGPYEVPLPGSGVVPYPAV